MTSPSGSRLVRVLALLLALPAFTACSKDPCDVVIYTYVDQLYSGPPLKRFEKETGLRVCATFPSFETRASGVLHKLLAQGVAPQVDVFWADDPVQPYVLAQKGLIEPYLSPKAEGIPAAFRDASGAWTGVGAQARVLLVNTKKVPKANAPRSIRNLTDPRWKGQAAMANPLHGSTKVHMAMLEAVWGTKETSEFLADIQKNDIGITATSWETKALVERGDKAFGLTNTDHALEAIAAGSPVTLVYPDQEKDGLGTLILPTSVMLIRTAPHPQAARRLVDHLVSPEVEAELVRTGAYFSLRPGGTVQAGLRAVEDVRAMPLDFTRDGEALQRLLPQLESRFDR